MSIEQHNELGATVAPNFTPEKNEEFIGKSFIGNNETGVYGGAYQFSSKVFTVETGLENIPASKLYTSFHFKEVKQWDTDHGVRKIRFEFIR